MEMKKVSGLLNKKTHCSYKMDDKVVDLAIERLLIVLAKVYDSRAVHICYRVARLVTI